MIRYLKQYPDILKVPVVSPVFVMGLPRTGTTLLHRLLSLDTKRFRAPLLWELLNPVPSRDKDGTHSLTHSLTRLFINLIFVQESTSRLTRTRMYSLPTKKKDSSLLKN